MSSTSTPALYDNLFSYADETEKEFLNSFKEALKAVVERGETTRIDLTEQQLRYVLRLTQDSRLQALAHDLGGDKGRHLVFTPSNGPHVIVEPRKADQ